jgi:hypothetical protein
MSLVALPIIAHPILLVIDSPDGRLAEHLYRAEAVQIGDIALIHSPIVSLAYFRRRLASSTRLAQNARLLALVMLGAAVWHSGSALLRDHAVKRALWIAYSRCG